MCKLHERGLADHGIFPGERNRQPWYISGAMKFRATHMPRHVHKERPHRDLLQIPDFSAKEIDRLFSLAGSMRAGKYKKKPLAGKSLAMIFMKASTRTRVS